MPMMALDTTDRSPMAFDPMLFLALAVGAGALAVRDALVTRLVAMAAIVVGIAFVATSGDMRLDVLLGMAALIAGNGYRLRLELRYRMEARLDSEQRFVLKHAFPNMHSRDWEILLHAGTRTEHKLGDSLIEMGSQTSTLSILMQGQLEERQLNGQGHFCGPSAMWGELSYCAGQLYSGFPYTLRVSSESAAVVHWNYETLNAVSAHRPRLRAALLEGFVRAAGMRQGLVVVDVPQAPQRPKAATATPERLQLEAVAKSA